MEHTVGSDTYRIVTTGESGQWIARAVRADSGERFGIELSADSAEAAAARLAQWLDWQAEHMQALAALQSAERDYHRAMADAAFAAGDGADAGSVLEAVDAARRTLDDVRARRPAM